MDERQFDHINVIPLVDIMLVLLTIVLTTSTLVATGTLPIQLPQAAPRKNELLKSQTIEIDKDGRIYLNSVAVALPALSEKLAAIDRNAPILIRADKTLPLQQFVAVLDRVNGQGFSRVGLQTEAGQQ
jgi:biopolymer transport protein ExbD